MSTHALMQRSTCYFSGRVQGVGFRYTAMNVAQEYAIGGFVRNLPDGRVELVIEGSASDRDAIIEELKRRMEDFISGVEVKQSPATGEFRRFTISD